MLGLSTIVEYLDKKGHEVDSNPNTKLEAELYDLLHDAYSTDQSVKKESEKLTLKNLRERQESLTIEDVRKPEVEEAEELLITDNTADSKETTPEPVVEKVKDEPVPAPEPEVEDPKVEVQKPKEKTVEIVEETSGPAAKEESKPKVEEPVKAAKEAEKVVEDDGGPKVVGMIDLDAMNQKTRPEKKSKVAAKEAAEKSKALKSAKKAAGKPEELEKEKAKEEVPVVAEEPRL